mgnify:FL=1
MFYMQNCWLLTVTDTLNQDISFGLVNKILVNLRTANIAAHQRNYYLLYGVIKKFRYLYNFI